MESNFITGQRALKRLLDDVENDTVSHAYILEGPRGIGKRTAADIFVRAAHCTGRPRPCGNCRACKLHRAGTHPDVIVVKPEENGNIKVEAIRQATEELYMRPRLAERKFLIIQGADGMTGTAQNALLKPFEEPPAYGTVLLLSENIQNLFATIRSRGVKLLMEPFKPQQIRAFVEAKYPERPGDSEFVARYSGGVVGKAIDICEDADFPERRDKLIEALVGMTGGKGSILPVAEAFGVGKKTDAPYRQTCFDILLSWLGDALIVKQGGRILNVDKEELLSSFASCITAGGIMAAIETVEETLRGLNPSMKYDLWVMDMLIKCWRDIHGYSSRS